MKKGSKNHRPANPSGLTKIQREWEKAILDCMKGRRTTKEVSLAFCVTQRCVEWKIARYRTLGRKSLVHGNKGRKRVLPHYEKLREDIRRIFLTTEMEGNTFRGISYAYFRWILEEFFGIRASESFVKKELKSIGYKAPRSKKITKRAVHLMRARREKEGELIQADGSAHDWLMNGTKTCVHGFIDDATGKLVGLYMTKNECSFGYHECFRMMGRKFGLPVALYTDKASVFHTVRDGKVRSDLTQFGRIMEEFGVELIPAHTPEAKGRVERMWQTLQHQLPYWFMLKNVRTIDEANAALREYIGVFNSRYARKARSQDTAWVPVSDEQLDRHLKITAPGKTDAGGVFSLKGYRFQCEFPKTDINICMSVRGGLWCELPGGTKRYAVRLIETDTTGIMPEVWKDLVDTFFLKNVKGRFREVYEDLDFQLAVGQ